MRMFALVALAGAVLAGPAAAQAPALSFTLQNTAAVPTDPVIVDGVNWRCDTAGACVGTGRGEEQPATRACRRLVARVGAVSSFTWRGTSLSADQLATCNASAAA